MDPALPLDVLRIIIVDMCDWSSINAFVLTCRDFASAVDADKIATAAARPIEQFTLDKPSSWAMCLPNGAKHGQVRIYNAIPNGLSMARLYVEYHLGIPGAWKLLADGHVTRWGRVGGSVTVTVYGNFGMCDEIVVDALGTDGVEYVMDVGSQTLESTNTLTHQCARIDPPTNFYDGVMRVEVFERWFEARGLELEQGRSGCELIGDDWRDIIRETVPECEYMVRPRWFCPRVNNFDPKISVPVYNVVMSPTIGVLCAVILCLVAYIVYHSRQMAAASPVAATVADTVEKMHGQHPPYCPCRKCVNPESRAMSENLEHFSTCMDGTCDNGVVSGAISEFGGTGGDFRDWIASQAVDTQVLLNHKEFVKDRLGNNNQNVTGRTYAMGEVEGTDQVPWQGIRGRPQAVETCNPTQQPDVDMRNFTTKPRFNWSSS